MIRRGEGTAGGTSVATSLLGGKALVTVKGLVMPRISEVGRQTLEIVSEMQARESPIEVVERLRPPDAGRV